MRNKLHFHISAPDEAAAAAARARWDSLAKPLGSLGLLEDAIVQIAALTGSADVSLKPRALLVFCADNGVVAQGVAQCGCEVTAAVAAALSQGRSTVCPMAQLADCTVQAIDVGMKEPTPQGVTDRHVMRGTNDITQGPAMTREQCLSAIRAGASLAKEHAHTGVKLLAVGEMGIGNTTTASAVTAALLGVPVETVTGRGAGLSDEGLRRKRCAIETALRLNTPDADDPVDVLTKVGGLDLAAMCGAYLGAAQARLPVLIDGFVSAAAALCAVRLCPEAASAMLASHVSAEPAGRLLLEALGKRALIDAGLRLGEGSGAVAAMPLLDMALAVYSSGETFSDRGIEPYIKLS